MSNEDPVHPDGAPVISGLNEGSNLTFESTDKTMEVLIFTSVDAYKCTF